MGCLFCLWWCCLRFSFWKSGLSPKNPEATTAAQRAVHLFIQTQTGELMCPLSWTYPCQFARACLTRTADCLFRHATPPPQTERLCLPVDSNWINIEHITCPNRTTGDTALPWVNAKCVADKTCSTDRQIFLELVDRYLQVQFNI